MTCLSCINWAIAGCLLHEPGFPDNNTSCPNFEYEPGSDEEEMTDGKQT